MINKLSMREIFQNIKQDMSLMKYCKMSSVFRVFDHVHVTWNTNKH